VRLYDPDLDWESRSLDMALRADELDSRANERDARVRTGARNNAGSRLMLDPYDESEYSDESEDDRVLLGTKVRRR
jgi:hypothetical protein